MATRTVKSDSGNDLKLSNNGGTGSVTITDAGDLTIDSPADIILDAEGADITLKDGGTAFGTLKQASGHLVIQPESSKEIILNDQGGTAALTVDIANQNVSINNGNLVMGTAGKGIDFSNQASPAAGMTSELLDSYEEGTVSATTFFKVGGSSVDITAGTTEIAAYTKIGSLCRVSYLVNTGAVDLGTGTVTLGLPFTASATTYTKTVAVLYIDGTGWIPLGYGRISNGSTIADVYVADGNAVFTTSTTSNRQLFLGLTYLTA